MSLCRHQALIPGRLDAVWRLVGDPARHPEWWPRVIEVRGLEFGEGDRYRQVTAIPTGQHETTLLVERLDDLREIHTRCMDTGTFAHWRLTEAQEDTFVDVELGIEPVGFRYRLFDAVGGRRYFRRWLEESLEGLRSAVDRVG